MNSRTVTTLFLLVSICCAAFGNKTTDRHANNDEKKRSTVVETKHTQKVATSNESKMTLLCIGKKNGLYIGGCTWFYRCKDEETEHVPCPVDLVVNELYMYCDYPEKVDPPCGKALNCTGVWDGNYPDFARRCKFYYTCLRGRFHGYTKCPASLYFDPDKDSCDWPNLIPAPCGTKGTQ